VAEHGDIESLTKIGIDCFRMAPEWNAPKPLIHAWWREILRRRDCKVLVFCHKEGISGFSIYVSHEHVWNEISASGPNRKIVKIIAAIVNPAIVKSKLQKRRSLKKSTPKLSNSEGLQCERREYDANARDRQPAWNRARFFLGIIAVSPMNQRAQAGSSLLSATEDLARESGAVLVRMHLDPRNERARSFYTKHGYAPAGNDHNSLVMTKELS
jgi:hypothetical protein